jgi:hypothetical protein
MTQEHYQWLDANRQVLGNIRMTPEQQHMVFDIYNTITGENKPITSCGRCVMNIKKTLKFYYEKQRSKNSRHNL